MPTFTKTVTMSGNSNYSITFKVTEVLPSDYIQTNKSNVNYTLTATKSAGSGYWDYNEENPVVVSINGSTVVNTNISYDFRNSTPKTITLASGTVTGIAHNSDGTKTIAVGGSFTDNGNYLGSATASGNLTLTTIPRQTTITSFTVSKRNETSFTFNWGTADTIDYVWYSTNNGSSWTGYDVTDGTSGSFNVTGLSPNTTYTCKLRVRRKDSQMTTDSSSVSQTTYKVPTQSLNTKTEVSIKMNWSIDTTADYIWYSTNNGSSWTAVGSVNATSGNYTISGLSASTTYNIKTRVRRSATQTTYDTTALAVTTASYPAFTTQPTYNARTETTLDVTYKPNMTVALAQYRIKISGGSYGNWVDINSNNIISGSATSTAGCTFRISSLTANTNYVVQVRLKSTLTEHYTNSSEVSTNMYTYAYPYCTESPNFTISNDGVTLKFYNPLSRTISINVIGNGTQLAYTWSTNSTSLKILDGSTTQSQLYATIPNKTSATYQVKVTYSGNINTRTNNNTYTINVNDCKPIFNDFSYSTNYSGLTGNNATIINGETTTTFTISTSNKATPKNSATITKYRLECGTQTKDVTYSSSASVSDTISNCANQIIKVSAIDSRGLETTVSKTVTNFVNYSKPSFRDITTNRNDGVETTTKLNFRVNYWNGSFGSLSNTITSVQYRSKLTTTSSYGSYTTIPVSSLTLSNGIARLEDYLIHANGSSGGFEVGKSYNVEVKVVDGNGSTTLETITTTSNITDGNVAFSTYQDSNGKYHVGINGMPSSFTQTVNGSFQATEGVYSNDYVYAAKSLIAAGYIEGHQLDSSGSGNYWYICELSTTAQYKDAPIEFCFIQRGRYGKIYIRPTNGTAGQLAIGFASVQGQIDVQAYYILANGKIQLYLKKQQGWDNGEIYVKKSHYMRELTITWKDENIASLPEGYVEIGIATEKLNISGNASTATSATTAGKANSTVLTLSNPSDSTVYYVPFIAGITDGTNYATRGNDGFVYYTREGTTSLRGLSMIRLGNTTASGTAKNKTGMIDLFANTGKYARIYPINSLSANKEYYLPDTTDGTTFLMASQVGSAAYKGVTRLTSKSYVPYSSTNLVDVDTIAFWNGAYNSSNSSNLTYAHQGTIQCKPKTLYDNTAGTTGSVALSDSAANYNYLEIYYTKSNSRVGCTKVHSPNGKYAQLIWEIQLSNTSVQFLTKSVNINAKNITVANQNVTNLASGSSPIISNGNELYIVKVVGYK